MLVGGFIEQKNFCTFLRIAVKSFFFLKNVRHVHLQNYTFHCANLLWRF